MKYNVGDVIPLVVETRKNGRKYIVVETPAEDSEIHIKNFQIIAKNKPLGTYKIAIDDDIVGWTISIFHIDYEGVARAFNGKKFYDVPESAIVETK